jgi:hypothetical protein
MPQCEKERALTAMGDYKERYERNIYYEQKNKSKNIKKK